MGDRMVLQLKNLGHQKKASAFFKSLNTREKRKKAKQGSLRGEKSTPYKDNDKGRYSRRLEEGGGKLGK